MKSIKVVIFCLVTLFTLLGCDFFSADPEETTTTVTTETTITSNDYSGPYFLGIEATNWIPEDDNDLDYKADDFKPISLSYRSSLKNSKTSLALTGSTPVYYTTKNAKDYLVISILQPEAVEDQYVISSITIEYPSGTKIKWTNSTTEPNGSRKWYSNFSNTLFYIPFTSPSTIEQEGYNYTVTAIQYINGIVNEDVRFAEDAKDSLLVYVEKSAITAQGAPIAEYYPEQNKIKLSSYYNIDQAIIKEIYINDVLQASGDLVLDNGDEIAIVNQFTSFANHFVQVRIVYDNGLGILRACESIAIIFGTYPEPYYFLPIYNLEQLNKIPRDFTSTLTLVDNITLPSDFIPFHGYQLSIHGSNRTLTVPNDLVFWEYYGDPEYLNVFDEIGLDMRNLSIEGRIKLVNHTNQIYNLYSHESIDHFNLTNIRFHDLNNL